MVKEEYEKWIKKNEPEKAEKKIEGNEKEAKNIDREGCKLPKREGVEKDSHSNFQVWLKCKYHFAQTK